MERRRPPKTVADLMVPLATYPNIPASATIKEAIALIRQGFEAHLQFGFRHALVLEEGHTLKGTISMTRLLRGLEPELLRADLGRTYRGFTADEGTALELFWERAFAEGLGQAVLKPVGAVARPVGITVKPGDPISRALHLMLAEDAPVLPVVEGNRVLGVIRLIDLFSEVVLLMSQPTGAAEKTSPGGPRAG